MCRPLSDKNEKVENRLFLTKRFVEGKGRAKLYQKTESSQSEMARVEEGLHIRQLMF
jgi:hypothetical protein